MTAKFKDRARKADIVLLQINIYFSLSVLHSNVLEYAFCILYINSFCFYLRQTMLQCTVLPDRIAALKMDIKEAVAGLPAPLAKKRFGT